MRIRATVVDSTDSLATEGSMVAYYFLVALRAEEYPACRGEVGVACFQRDELAEAKFLAALAV